MQPVNRGFTLIELLVVIAIIGLLSSVVLASLRGARIKGMDARRLSDARQIQTALELYVSNNTTYPNTSGNWVNSTQAQPWIPGLDSTFIAAVPVDPRNVSSAALEVIYYYNSNGTSYCMQISQEGPCSTNPQYWGIWNGTCKIRYGDYAWCTSH